MKIYYISAVLVLLVFLSAAACQKETPATKPTTQTPTAVPQEPIPKAPPAGADVKIGRSYFNPITAEIKRGATVTWKNTDTRKHKLQIVGTTIVSPTLEPGDSWEQEFDEAGEYRIYDIFSKFEGYVEVRE